MSAGFDGVAGANPNLPVGQMGGFANTFMPILAQWYAASMGGVPAQFVPQQGFHDQLRAQQQLRDMQAAMAATAAAEAERFHKMLQGGTHLGGGDPSNPETARILGILRDDYKAGSPYMSMLMPRWLQSAIGGRQGSARLAGQDLLFAGSNAIDPMTGAIGLSGQSAGLIAERVASMLYGDGVDPAIMRGVKIDEASNFLLAMKRRGDGPRSIRSQFTEEEVARLEAASKGGNFDIRNIIGRDRLAGLSEQDIMLLQNGQGTIQDRLVNVDAKRMAEYMKDNVGLMRAMKDVFGPNTDWAEAMQMLRDMTQGNAQGLSRSELEMALRTAKEAAAAGRMSLEELKQVSGFLGDFAASQGMHRRGAFQAATNVAHFRTAFEAMGLGAVDKLDIDKLAIMSGQLQIQAGNSPVAASFGATLNLNDAVGGFKEGSRAARYLSALKSGALEFEGRSIYLSPTEWRQMMKEAGVDMGLIRNAEMSTDMNMKSAIDAGLDMTVRNLQFRSDIAPLMTNAMRFSIGQMGVNRGDAASLSDAALNAIMGMDHELYAEDKQGRLAALVEALRKTPAGAQMSEARLKQIAGNAIISFETVANQRGWGSGSAIKALFDPRILAEQAGAKFRSAQMADLSKHLSGLGGHDVTTRIVEMIMNADEKTSIQDIGKSILNIVNSEDVQAAARPHIEKIMAERAAYMRMLRDPKMLDADSRTLNEAGLRAAEAHIKRLETLTKDMNKDVEAAAAEAAKKPTAGKSSTKDPASSDMTSGGKEKIEITGTLSFGGLKIPLIGTGTRVLG